MGASQATGPRKAPDLDSILGRIERVDITEAHEHLISDIVTELGRINSGTPDVEDFKPKIAPFLAAVVEQGRALYPSGSAIRVARNLNIYAEELADAAVSALRSFEPGDSCADAFGYYLVESGEVGQERLIEAFREDPKHFLTIVERATLHIDLDAEGRERFSTLAPDVIDLVRIQSSTELPDKYQIMHAGSFLARFQEQALPKLLEIVRERGTAEWGVFNAIVERFPVDAIEGIVKSIQRSTNPNSLANLIELLGDISQRNSRALVSHRTEKKHEGTFKNVVGALDELLYAHTPREVRRAAVHALTKTLSPLSLVDIAAQLDSIEEESQADLIEIQERAKRIISGIRKDFQKKIGLLLYWSDSPYEYAEVVRLVGTISDTQNASFVNSLENTVRSGANVGHNLVRKDIMDSMLLGTFSNC